MKTNKQTMSKKINKNNIINLGGEPIESFERVSKIKEIILLGEDNEIRRIILA